MATLQNATGRLLALIHAAGQHPPNMVSRDAWRVLLRVEEKGNISELLSRLAAVMNLPSEAEAEIRRLEHVKVDHLLVWVPVVHQAFSVINLGAHWETFRKPFDTDARALHALEIASDMVARQFPQAMIDENELEEIRNEVVELRSMTLAAELDEDLKLFILANLREIEAAIEQYQIRGTAGLREVVQRAYGEVLLRPTTRERVERTPVGHRYAKVLHRILISISLSADLIALNAWKDQQLLPPPAIIESPAPDTSPPNVPEITDEPTATRTQRV
jgi:hypothetical protein